MCVQNVKIIFHALNFGELGLILERLSIMIIKYTYTDNTNILLVRWDFSSELRLAAPSQSD